MDHNYLNGFKLDMVALPSKEHVNLDRVKAVNVYGLNHHKKNWCSQCTEKYPECSGECFFHAWVSYEKALKEN